MGKVSCALMQRHVETMTGWLDCVHLPSAPQRVAEDLAEWVKRDVPNVACAREHMGRTCLHEAAHAAAGHSWGATISRVVVRSDGTGGVWSLPENSAGQAVELLAGPFAELFIGADPTRQFGLAHSSDIMNAAMIIPTTSFDHRAVAMMTAVTVTGLWETVTRIAVALQEYGELNGSAVAAFLAEPQ